MELHVPAALYPRRKHLLPNAREVDPDIGVDAVEKKIYLTLAEIEPRFLMLFNSYPILE
jgi:hypothetical protein